MNKNNMPFYKSHDSESLSSTFKNLTSGQRDKLKKIVSYVLCVYAPSFVMIRLHPKTPEDPYLTLFRGDLLFAYREIAPSITNLVMSFYLEHASHWLS